MKTKLLLIVLLIGGCCTAAAQSRIWEMPTIPADTTIVREWKEGKYIVYSRQGTSQSVSYHDNSSPVVRSAQIPSNVIINDFRIAGEKVYAGGKVLGTPYSHGLLACFEINDLLGSSGVFHVYVFNSINLMNSNCETNYTDQVTEVKRIKLFQYGSTDHIAYIANDSIINLDPWIEGCRRMGYGDFCFTGSSWTPYRFNYNKDGINVFSDMAITDNYIALASKSCEYDRFEFVVHNKIIDYANIIPTPPYHIYYFTDHKVLGRVMATALGGDTFAVAYHYDAPPLGAGLAVKIFNIVGGAPTLLYSLEVPPTVMSSNWCEMRDIVYVNNTGELWLLNDIKSPATGMGGSYIYRIDMGNVYAGVYEAHYIPDYYQLHSLDYYLNKGYISSGKESDALKVLIDQNPTLPVICPLKENVAGRATAPVMQYYGRSHCTFLPGGSDLPFPFNVKTRNTNILCNQIKGGMQQ